MANIKSQIKRNRQNEAARLRNKAVRSSLKTATKKAVAGDSENAGAIATRLLDKAASKGTLHKRAAARRKSRLARRVNESPAG